jgi:hypothetical protein
MIECESAPNGRLMDCPGYVHLGGRMALNAAHPCATSLVLRATA